MMPRLKVADRMPPPENDTPNGLRRWASRSGVSPVGAGDSPRRFRRWPCSVRRTLVIEALIGLALLYVRDATVGGSSGLNAQVAPFVHVVDPASSCRQAPAMTWQSLAPPSHREVLDRWCDSVGPPFVRGGSPPPERLATLVLATWNVHGGNGDVEAFLRSVPAVPGVRSPYGVVLLLQEAVRAGADVPERYPDRMRPPGTIRVSGRERDVGALTARLAMHTLYVPSMRNGRIFTSDMRQDRGNAILSTFPLEDLRAIELPFGRQRHVAVAARVSVPGLPPLRVMSVHLDP